MQAPRASKAIAAGSAATLVAGLAAGCGASKTAAGGDTGGGGGKSVNIAVAKGWADDVAVTQLWKYVLEEKGYTVTTTSLDIAPIFIGVAQNDLDMYLDVWLPVTHATYWKKYGDKVADLGAWYDQATLDLAVPTYVKASSIADLKGMGDQFDNTITGIEPAAGETKIVKKAMKAYGLNDYKLQTSSTTAMLAALKNAAQEKKPIVVTLWHPHWAYSAFPIKDLADPKGAMGKPEKVHAMASKQFAGSHPKIVKALKNFRMDDKTFSSLEKVVAEKHSDHPEAGMKIWAKSHQSLIDGLVKSVK